MSCLFKSVSRMSFRFNLIVLMPTREGNCSWHTMVKIYLVVVLFGKRPTLTENRVLWWLWCTSVDEAVFTEKNCILLSSSQITCIDCFRKSCLKTRSCLFLSYNQHSSMPNKSTLREGVISRIMWKSLIWQRFYLPPLCKTILVLC